VSLTANTLAPDALARLHLAHVLEHGRAVQAAAIAAELATDEPARAAFEAAMQRAAGRLGAATDSLGRECAALAWDGYGALVVAIRAEYDRGRYEVAEGSPP
jgi:CHASE2 domain-containing sensor protein